MEGKTAVAAALLKNNAIDVRPAGARATDTAPTAGVSFETVAINGLYQFLTERARLELESYLAEELKKQLCGTYRPYFAQTCTMLDGLNDNTGVFQSFTLEELRTPLAHDIRYLPACIIHKPAKVSEGSDVGYLLMDVYSQLTSGAKKSGNILYGLARDPHIAAECVDATKGHAKPDDFRCRTFEALTAVAAGIQVAQLPDLTLAQRGTDFVTVFLYDLALFSCPRGLQDDSFDQVTSRCNTYLLAKFPPDSGGANTIESVAHYLDTADKVFSAVAAMKSLLDQLNDTSKLLQAASGDAADNYRAQIVGLLASLAQQVGDAYRNGLCMALDPTKPCSTQLDAQTDIIKPVTDALAAYAQISAGNYVAALSSMPFLSQQVSTQYLVPAARLAQAKTAADFSATLNSIASPAGVWRIKKLQTMWSVVSFVGIQGGSERLEGRGTSSKGSYYGAYIPFGIGWSHPLRHQSGYWGAYLSALDLGILASNHTDRQAADAGTKTNISTVLSPSLSLYINPGWLGPVTFGLGYVYRTPGLRTFTTTGGDRIKLDSSRIMLTVGVDVTVFRLTH